MPVFLEDISNGLENKKVSFVNNINSLLLPEFVKYTSNCVLKSESFAEDFDSISPPCNCSDDCNTDCPCSVSQVFDNGKLSEDYNNITTKPIIECSDLCNCKENCINRLVQNGICFSLQVFLTESRGFGVQTRDFIPKFSFVCEYAGEIIDDCEAQLRLSKQSPGDSNYIYVLKEHSGKNKFVKTIIDPTYIGNVGRYLNHSCSPNLISVPVRANNMIPRICFFAADDILPLQELTYNYGGDCTFRNSLNLLHNEILICKARKCLCQSLNCSGLLPFLDDDWIN